MRPAACFRLRTFAVMCLPFLASLAVASPARAADPSRPAVGFSKLLVRLDSRDEIGIGSLDDHVRLIEHMRARGLNAVGAENLVFGRDETRRAQYLVGGTVKELACEVSKDHVRCRIGVEWQLLDVASDAVVYAVLSRAAVDTSPAEKEHLAGALLDAAMDKLIARDRFREALKAIHPPREDAQFAEATIARCAPGRRIAETADDVLSNVAVIETNGGFGSGFFVSRDGLVLTAAHVVEGSLRARLRDGTQLELVPVRVAPGADVALLRTKTPVARASCAALRDDTPPSGQEVYVAGAPASTQLAFSLTRGIVSGYPVIDGRRRLQTDAPVNPGNSGGPLVDGSGAVLGVVSSKLVSSTIEGMAFAAPMHETLAALGLRVGGAGAATDPRLMTETATAPEAREVPTVWDQADAVPSIDPEGDARRKAARERAASDEAARSAESERDEATPGYVHVLKWGGLATGAVGLITIPISYVLGTPSTVTHPQFTRLEAFNTAGWVALGVGGGALGLSFVLRPPLKPAQPAASAIQIGPGSVSWTGSF